MLHFLRKNKCFYCKGALGEDYSVIRYGSIPMGTIGEEKVCKECADLLDKQADYDEDTF